MTNKAAPQTITPERQQAAAQIGQVFNSLHDYINTLMHANEDGVRLTSQPLEFARKSIEEASFWAIKHVLMHGVPAKPKAPEAPPADPAAPAAETPAPIGVVDPAPPGADAPTGADALPPTTPAESV